MINGYDFDETIYDGDSSVDFYLYSVKRNKKVLLNLPIQIYGLILYILGLIDKTKCKEYIFSFLKRIDNVDDYIKDFWKINYSKIKQWYLKQKDKSDVIISASPEFLLKPLEKKLKVKIIATKVNKYTGKFESKNCHGKEKVKRFLEETEYKNLKAFYSDSMSDKPMMDLSIDAYLVKKNTIYDLKDDREGNIKKKINWDKYLLIFGLLYLVIPISMQLFFWFNRLISIPCIIMLFTATYLTIKKFKPLTQEEYQTIFNKKKIIFFVLMIIVLNLMSGAGGIFQQNWDYHGRNAIFKDLIYNSWPVRYDYSNLAYESKIFGNAGFLNYYFAFWLPGAAVGKILGFKVGSLFMLLWQTIGTLIFFYYLVRFMKNIKYRYFFIFIAFGGLNIIGHLVIQNYYYHSTLPAIGTTHIDTSMGSFCMSSFITQLFWVFNQSIPTWILVMLFLQEKDYRKCGFYFALLVPYGPFPMLGFLYLIFTYIIFGKRLDKFIDFDRIKSLLTIENFFGCISVLPVVFMYTLNESLKGMRIVDAINNGNLKEVLINYIAFIVLEFFIYIIIINKKNYKQIIMCFLFFTIAPLFYIGGADLGNRATIPLLLVLYILVLKYLDEINKKDKKVFLKQKFLIVILLLAFMTNFNEFYRSLKNTYLNYKNNEPQYADSYKTFKQFEGKECATFITNFVATDDKDNKVLQFLLRK